MTAPRYMRLSKGSLLLLHLVAAGHVWRDDRGLWVASTQRTKRNVDFRIKNMIDKGFLLATYRDNFPRLTQHGSQYLAENPLENVLAATTIR